MTSWWWAKLAGNAALVVATASSGWYGWGSSPWLSGFVCASAAWRISVALEEYQSHLRERLAAGYERQTGER